jgi:hypothetical protein
MDVILLNANGQSQSHFTKEDLDPLYIGMNELVWNGSDANGNSLPGGVYVYEIRLSVNGELTRKIGKLVLVR